MCSKCNEQVIRLVRMIHSEIGGDAEFVLYHKADDGSHVHTFVVANTAEEQDVMRLLKDAQAHVEKNHRRPGKHEYN